jgi:hypothetical protein
MMQALRGAGGGQLAGAWCWPRVLAAMGDPLILVSLGGAWVMCSMLTMR